MTVEIVFARLAQERFGAIDGRENWPCYAHAGQLLHWRSN